MKTPSLLSVAVVVCLVTSMFASGVSAQSSTVVSTELINFYNMTSGELNTYLDYVDAQDMPVLVIRLNAMSEFQSGTSQGITKAKELISLANSKGIAVAVDLHTWYTTWDNYFRDSASNCASYRAKYLTYVSNVVSDFADSNVFAFMVLNEPQARTATASENNFILSCISTAKAETNKPVSVRFMCGYSPSTGHYSSAIDSATDFLCRNTYWDPRSPTVTVYGSTQTNVNKAISTAHGMGKQIWFTEFGKTNSNTETQRAYVAGFVSWAKGAGVDAVYCWVCQPDSTGESYNLFNGYTPLPAFYELTGSGNAVSPISGTVAPTPTSTPTVTPTPQGNGGNINPTPTVTPNPTNTPVNPVFDISPFWIVVLGVGFYVYSSYSPKNKGGRIK